VAAKATLADEARGAVTAGGRMLSSLRGSHTPIYASPQQRGGSDPDPRDDVHALGVIAYQMLTGHLTQGPGPDYTHDLVDAGTPQPLIELIGRCVAQNPARRPATATELAAELDKMSAPTVTVVPPPASPPAVPVPPKPSAEVEKAGAEEEKQAVTNDDHPKVSADGEDEDQPDPEPVPEYELDVVVSGNWRMNRVVKPFKAWRLVTKLPAKVKVKPGEVYKLDIMRSAKDANVQGLAALTDVQSLHELDLTGCKRLTEAGFALAAKLTHLRTLILTESAAGDAALKPSPSCPTSRF